eukprot:GHVP01017413.1.p1 GENE.GHVP01017413.1~~GHVP01017413.1.p1  ORF type:complete len:686 (+),score=179.69 GHVP01017413.1:289-2346(+)
MDASGAPPWFPDETGEEKTDEADKREEDERIQIPLEVKSAVEMSQNDSSKAVMPHPPVQSPIAPRDLFNMKSSKISTPSISSSGKSSSDRFGHPTFPKQFAGSQFSRESLASNPFPLHRKEPITETWPAALKLTNPMSKYPSVGSYSEASRNGMGNSNSEFSKPKSWLDFHPKGLDLPVTHPKKLPSAQFVSEFTRKECEANFLLKETSNMAEAHDRHEDEIKKLRMALNLKTEQLERANKSLSYFQEVEKGDKDVNRTAIARIREQASDEAEKKHHERVMEMMQKQAQSLMNMAKRQSSEAQQECEELRAETLNQETLISDLKKALADKSHQVMELERILDQQVLAAKAVPEVQKKIRQQYEKDADTKVALMSAEMNSLREQNQKLLEKNTSFERSLQRKDQEIASMKIDLADRETNHSRIERELTALKFDLKISNESTDTTKKEKDLLRRQFAHKLERAEAQHNEELRNYQERFQSELAAKDLENKETLAYLKEMEIRLNDFQESHSEEIAIRKSREEENIDLRKRLDEIGREWELADKGPEIDFLRLNEENLKGRVMKLSEELAVAQQDTIILTKYRAENVALTKQVSELKTELERLKKHEFLMDKELEKTLHQRSLDTRRAVTTSAAQPTFKMNRKPNRITTLSEFSASPSRKFGSVNELQSERSQQRRRINDFHPTEVKG